MFKAIYIFIALCLCLPLAAGKKKKAAKPTARLVNPDYNNDMKVAGSEMIYWMRHISTAFDHGLFKDDKQIKLLYRMMDKVDSNHNFKLEREEKEAFKSEMYHLFGEVHKKILEEFDINNNSRLDTKELVAARSAHKSFTAPLYKNLETRFGSSLPPEKKKKKKKN